MRSNSKDGFVEVEYKNKKYIFFFVKTRAQRSMHPIQHKISSPELQFANFPTAVCMHELISSTSYNTIQQYNTDYGSKVAGILLDV